MCSPVKTEMTESVQKGISENFSRELQSFFVLCLLNLVFGALALAFGMQFIVTAVLAMAGSGSFGIFPFLQGLVGWAATVIGFRWILSSVKVLKGVTKIRREYRAMEEPVPAEALTGLIIRMMAHYRENWKTLWKMNLFSMLGGCIFLALGILNLVQGISAAASGSVPAYTLIVQAGLTSGIGRSVFLSFFAAGINLAIGLASLLFSTWFRRYSRAWELRLIEASHSEETLKTTMEQS